MLDELEIIDIVMDGYDSQEIISILQWCKANCTKKYYYIGRKIIDDNDFYSFGFESNSDAIIFKLSWI